MSLRNGKTESLLGERYDKVGHGIISLRDEQIHLRDALTEKIRTGIFQLENHGCLCNAHDGLDLQLASVDRYGIPNRVVICMNCGLVRVNPRMNEKAYSDFYREIFGRLYGGRSIPSERYDDMYEKRGISAAWLDNFIDLAGKDVIEIGAGGGWYLMQLKERGCTVVGYDYDRLYLELGRSKGLDLREGGIPEATKTGQCYDLVILSHVVEHFLYPARDLKDLQRLLRPSGVVYVEVPGLLTLHNNNSQGVMLYLQTPHTHYFTLKTLSNLMVQCGYQMMTGDETVRSLWTVSSKEAQFPWKADPEFARVLLNYLLRCEASRENKLDG
jgi:SAM-dependent methyltransferase